MLAANASAYTVPRDILRASNTAAGSGPGTVFYGDGTGWSNFDLKAVSPTVSGHTFTTGYHYDQYHLRNQTASFLIHCQGPVPLVSRPEGEARRVYYNQALETFGHEARRLWQELESELIRIGEDIQRFGAELEQ